MATSTGGVNYRSVLPYKTSDRKAFDGTVPYAVSCTGIASFNNTSGSEASTSIVFSLIGQPGDNNVYGSDASLLGIKKQVGVVIDDLWFDVVGSSGVIRISVAACDPSAFPDYTKTILYDCQLQVDSSVGAVKIKVPLMNGIILSGNTDNPLNICVQISALLGNGSNARVFYHGVSIVDD